MEVERELRECITAGRQNLQTPKDGDTLESRLAPVQIPELCSNEFRVGGKIAEIDHGYGNVSELNLATVSDDASQRICDALSLDSVPEICVKTIPIEPQLPSDPVERGAALVRSARVVWMSDDTKYRENERLLTTLAYNIDHARSLTNLTIFMPLVDMDLRIFLEILYRSQTSRIEKYVEMREALGKDPRSLIREMQRRYQSTEEAFETITQQLLDGLAEFHLSGGVHRDLKPENIGIRWRNGRPEAYAMDWEGAKNVHIPEDGATSLYTTLALQRTQKYLPDDRVSSARGTQDLRNPVDDVYAMSLMMLEMLGLRSAEHERNETWKGKVRDTLASDIRDRCRFVGLPGLEYVLTRGVLGASAENIEHCYPNMVAFRDDVSLIRSGRATDLRAVTRNPHATECWEQRKGLKEYSRRSVRRFGRRLLLAAGALGALTVAGMSALDIRDAQTYRQAYGTSLEQRGREVAVGSSTSWQRFFDSIGAVAAQDEEVYRHIRDQEGLIVPAFSVVKDEGVLHHERTVTAVYRNWMQHIIPLAVFGNQETQEVFLPVMADYLSGLEADLSGDESDFRRSAVGRVEPILHHREALQELEADLRESDPELAQHIAIGLKKSQYLGLVAAQQIVGQRARDTGGQGPEEVTARIHYRLLPAGVEMVLRPSLFDIDTTSTFDSEVAWRTAVANRISPELSSYRLLEALLLYSTVVNEQLITEGHSYGRAERMVDGTYHQTDYSNIGNVVVTSDVARLLVGNAHMARLCTAVLDEGGSLQRELQRQAALEGVDWGEVKQRVHSTYEHVLQGSQRLESQLYAYTNHWSELPPPSVVFDSQESAQYSNLSVDATTWSLYALSLAIAEDPRVEAVFERFLEQARLRTPDRPELRILPWELMKEHMGLPTPYMIGNVAFSVGFAPESTIGLPGYDGPNIFVTGALTETTSRILRKKEE